MEITTFLGNLLLIPIIFGIYYFFKHSDRWYHEGNTRVNNLIYEDLIENDKAVFIEPSVRFNKNVKVGEIIGRDNGEYFRENVLMPALHSLEDKQVLYIDFRKFSRVGVNFIDEILTDLPSSKFEVMWCMHNIKIIGNDENTKNSSYFQKVIQDNWRTKKANWTEE